MVPNQNPRIGQPFSALLTNLTPSQPAFGLLGFDYYYPNPFLDLATLGMPGCSLYVLPEILDYTPDTGIFGAFIWGYVLPDDPSLTNLRFSFQFLVGDPAANSVGLVATNAIRCVIGY